MDRNTFHNEVIQETRFSHFLKMTDNVHYAMIAMLVFWVIGFKMVIKVKKKTQTVHFLKIKVLSAVYSSGLFFYFLLQ